MRIRAAFLSGLLHTAAVLLLLFLTIRPPAPRLIDHVVAVSILKAPVLRSTKTKGGGGDRTSLPPRKDRRVFLPPTVPLEESKLIVRPALIEGADGVGLGDPNGVGPGSLGPGGPFGFGSGPGESSGVPGPPQVPVKVTRGPEVVYKQEPDYSEEARKARHQGTVLLSIEVGANGQPGRIRVVRALGLGLDEKAIEAVSHWRFRPALSGNQPVAVSALVEVSFHLL